jgi:hypothetical protein
MASRFERNEIDSLVARHPVVWMQVCGRQTSSAERVEVQRNFCGSGGIRWDVFPFFDGGDGGFNQDWISSEHFGIFHIPFGGDYQLQADGAANLAHLQQRGIVGLDTGNQFSRGLGILLGL